MKIRVYANYNEESLDGYLISNYSKTKVGFMSGHAVEYLTYKDSIRERNHLYRESVNGFLRQYPNDTLEYLGSHHHTEYRKVIKAHQLLHGE